MAAKLIKGRVAVIVDGTPFVLTIPMLFTETFQAVEDYYTRPYYANFLRILRVIAYVLTIMLPGNLCGPCHLSPGNDPRISFWKP